jgi:hypothetical protein
MRRLTMCEREGDGERGRRRRADGQSDEECERHAPIDSLPTGGETTLSLS